MRILPSAWLITFLCLQGPLLGQTSIRVGPSTTAPRATVVSELRVWRNMSGRAIKARLRGYDGVNAPSMVDNIFSDMAMGSDIVRRAPEHSLGCNQPLTAALFPAQKWPKCWKDKLYFGAIVSFAEHAPIIEP